jgi:hypothetical protein
MIEKTDRHGQVRCTCTVTDDGILYAGTTYRSISAAALAAAKDLGLTNTTQNGFVFWGLTKPTSPVKPAEALERAWNRYHDHLQRALKHDHDKTITILKEHATRIASALAL